MDNEILGTGFDNQVMKFLFGEIQAKQKSDGNIYISGYASTNAPDLVGEIIPPSAFVKNLPAYQNNPIYCYNHDPSLPIGRVNQLTVTEKGLYLDEVKISNTKFVQDNIAPLILDKVLTQQSIGFYSLKGAREGKYYKHLDVYMKEASLVPIACNPTAVLDALTVKGLPLFNSVEEYMEAYVKGDIALPIKFYMEAHYKNAPEEEAPVVEETIMHKNTNVLNPDFSDLEVLQPTQKNLLKLDKSAETAKVDNKDNSELLPCIFLAKKSDSYMFCIGEVTEKGYRLNWEDVVVNLGRLFGVKGGFLMNEDTKASLVERIGVAYTLLSKRIPEHEGVRVTDLDASKLTELKYHDLEFFEGEKDTIWNKVLENDLTNIINIFEKAQEEKKEFSETVVEKVKSFLPHVSVAVSGYAFNKDDFNFLASLMNLLESHREPSEGGYELALTDEDKVRLEKLLEVIPTALTEEKEVVKSELTEEDKLVDDEFLKALESFIKI